MSGRFMEHNIDIVRGTQWGDEGKGKITDWVLKTNQYDVNIRVQGGNNAGHTIKKSGKVYHTHILPSGVLTEYDDQNFIDVIDRKLYTVKGKKLINIIGRGCVVHPKELDDELKQFEEEFPNIRDRVKISLCVHLVTEDSREEDKKNDKVGSTGKGIGQTYSKKCLRVNPRVCDIPTIIELEKDMKEEEKLLPGIEEYFKDGKFCGCEIIDEVEYFKNNPEKLNILVEMAQGSKLGLDHGTYPYCTSSPMMEVGVINTSGLSTNDIRNVFSCAKVYETYVGKAQMQNNDDELWSVIQEIGKEYGVTTGRKRQCLPLDLSALMKFIYINRDTVLFFNKCDILKLTEEYMKNNNVRTNYKSPYLLVENDDILEFSDWEYFKNYINQRLTEKFPKLKIFYSSTPDGSDLPTEF